jgi:hypothetical protein
MASVFDDPREVLDPPTWAELWARIGEPILSFRVGDADVLVPQGLLACCRVVHQPHCNHHVALNLIGCDFEVRLPSGEVQPRSPLKQVFAGDVLASPRDLRAAVEATRLMAISTAAQQGGLLASMQVDVWLLSLELAAIWRYLGVERQQALWATLAQADHVPDDAIEMLPIVLLAEDGAREETARLLAQPDFRHATAYAHRVLVLPSEIGHDDQARYITTAVWGTPDDVSPAAEAITRDPSERPLSYEGVVE